MSSPISRIPTELLVEIFLWSTTSALRLQPTLRTSITSPEDTPAFDITALAISQVCGLWRAISFTISIMWSTMKVYDPSATTLNLVELYLFRAGPSTLLTLELVQDIRDPQTVDVEIEYSKAIFDLWFAHAERWKSIHFDFQTCRPPLALIHASAERFPNLQDVFIQYGIYGSTQDYFMLQEFWETIHTLPTLKTTFWQYGHIPSAPFRQLTRFTLRKISLDDIYEVLKQCHQLEHLTIEEFAWGLLTGAVDRPDLEMAALVVPNLTVLHMSSQGDSAGAQRLLRMVTTPCLEDLAIYNIPNDFPKSSLANHLSRSGCVLRSLTLGHLDSGADTSIIKTLRKAEEGHYLDQLERLELQGGFSHDIFKLFKVAYRSSTETKPGLPPLLQTRAWDVKPSILQLDLHVPFPSLLVLMVDWCGQLPDGILGSILLGRAEVDVGLWRLECRIWAGIWKDVTRGDTTFIRKKDKKRFSMMEERFGSSDIKLIYM